jgi:hypothetical protein
MARRGCTGKRKSIGGGPLWGHIMSQWYFRLADYILVAIICLLTLRLLLAATLDISNAIHRGVSTVTDPVVKAVGAITPRVVPAGLVVGAAIFWLLSLRILLFIASSAMAMRRALG